MLVEKLNVLNIEDNFDDYILLKRALEKHGFLINSARVDTMEELKDALTRHWDVVISDNTLPSLSAFEALRLVRSKNNDVPFIILSGTIDERKAAMAMERGANDYILKDNITRLIPAIKRELKEADNRQKKRLTEAELTVSKKQYIQLTNSIEDIFVALNSNFKIVFWNSAAEKETGFSQSQVLGHEACKMIPHLEGKGLNRAIKKVIKTNKKTRHDFVIKTNKKEEFYEAQIYPYDSGVSIIARKITERVEMMHKLQATNNELETFMYKLSHDMKSPITSIEGLLNLGKLEFKEKNKVLAFLNKMELATKRLDKILDELLDITRIKQEPVKIEKVDVTAVVEQVKGILAYAPGFSDTAIYLNAKVPHIYTDQRLLKSILLNLIHNAIKYRSADERPFVNIDFSITPGHYVIEVTDNGIGVPENMRQDIFDMFIRANNQFEGTGLGLYIVKNAVQKLSGSFYLNDNKYKGTTVGFKLPAYRKQ